LTKPSIRAPDHLADWTRIIGPVGGASALQNLIALAGRLMLACIFVREGWLKIASYSGVVEYMEANGVSGKLLPVVIMTELGGGLLAAFGLLTRVAALALAGFCLLTALLFHRDLGDPDQAVNFYKNIAMAGGFLMLLAFGPGAWSADALIRRR
jgi:putative oxidoreductase